MFSGKKLDFNSVPIKHLKIEPFLYVFKKLSAGMNFGSFEVLSFGFLEFSGKDFDVFSSLKLTLNETLQLSFCFKIKYMWSNESNNAFWSSFEAVEKHAKISPHDNESQLWLELFFIFEILKI